MAGARRGVSSPPGFRKRPGRPGSELGGAPASANTALAPPGPRSALAPGKPAASPDLLFGFVCASVAGADTRPFKTSRLRQAAICSAPRRRILSCVSAASAGSVPHLPLPAACSPTQGGSHQLPPAPVPGGRPRPGVRRQPLRGQWWVRALPGRLGTAWEPHALPGSQAEPRPRPAFAVSAGSSLAAGGRRWLQGLGGAAGLSLDGTRSLGAWPLGARSLGARFWPLFGSHSRCLGRGRWAPWVLQGWELESSQMGT